MKLDFDQINRKINNKLTFKEVSSSGTQITNSNLKNFTVKRAGWNGESTEYSSAETDLEEIKSAIETDSYIKVALDKTQQLIFKAGYKITSNNEAAVEYLEQRLKIMEFGTDVPFDILLKETARDLVYYSNSFWVKSRIDKIQGVQNVKAVLGKKPVGGYFRMDPTIVQIARAEDGSITGYQLSGTNEQTFNKEDVVHFYIDRDPSNNFGTPRIISSLEDIRILRKIEGNTLSLIYRFAIPLYQMKIGLPQENFMATNQEISEAQDQINKMPMDGIIVTNERTDFNAIGADGKAIELGDYLNYFENRAFTGLNVSQAMMGRGGTKQDADSMEGLMHDTVKYFQSNLSVFIEKFVFNELLLEGGYNPIFNADDEVKFEFNEINLDTKIKQENHYINEYQGNAISFEEMRRAIGRKAEGVDENRLYTTMITTKSAVDVLNAKTAAENATGNGNLSNGSGQSSATPNGAVSSVSQPTNQHGTTSAKMNESLSLNENMFKLNNESPLTKKLNQISKKNQHEARFKNQYSQMYKLFMNMRNDIAKTEKFPKTKVNKYIKEFSKEFNILLEDSARLGYSSSQLLNTIVDLKDLNPDYVSNDLKELSKKQIESFITGLADKINQKERPVIDVFDFMAYRLRFASEYLSQKSYNYAYVLGCKEMGVPKLKLNLSDKHKEEYDSTIDTNNFNINQIPPFSPYCSCGIQRPEGIIKE